MDPQEGGEALMLGKRRQLVYSDSPGHQRAAAMAFAAEAPPPLTASDAASMRHIFRQHAAAAVFGAALLAAAGCNHSDPLSPDDGSSIDQPDASLAIAHATGSLASIANDYDPIPIASAPGPGAVPASASLIADMPPIGNQGAQGSCVAWAVSYALKSFQEQEERKWGYGSNQHIFSPAFVYNQIKVSDCLNGSYVVDAFRLLQDVGDISLSEMPYDQNSCSAKPSPAMNASAHEYRIDGYRRLKDAHRIDEYKTFLAARIPVVVAIKIFTEFDQLGKQVLKQAKSLTQFQHALVVVAYDDGQHALAVYNSWGKSWGDSGVGWIDYDLFTGSFVVEAYVSTDHIQAGGCVDGQTRPCGVTSGKCVAGMATCSLGQWGSCVGEIGPDLEICGDGIDNNCDGRTDEICGSEPLPVFLFDP